MEWTMKMMRCEMSRFCLPWMDYRLTYLERTERFTKIDQSYSTHWTVEMWESVMAVSVYNLPFDTAFIYNRARLVSLHGRLRTMAEKKTEKELNVRAISRSRSLWNWSVHEHCSSRTHSLPAVSARTSPSGQRQPGTQWSTEQSKLPSMPGVAVALSPPCRVAARIVWQEEQRKQGSNLVPLGHWASQPSSVKSSWIFWRLLRDWMTLMVGCSLFLYMSKPASGACVRAPESHHGLTSRAYWLYISKIIFL